MQADNIVNNTSENADERQNEGLDKVKFTTVANDAPKEGYSDNPDDLAKVLEIPVQEVEENTSSSENPFDVLEGMQPKASSEKTDSNGGSAPEDDMDVESHLFDDPDAMADLGVELIDMVFVYSAMGIAGDFTDEGEKRFSVSAARKKRLKDPLKKILRNREMKMKPEAILVIMILIMYAPGIWKAFQEKQAKKKAEKQKKEQAAKDQQRRRQMAEKQVTLDEIQKDLKGKPGRPAGSLDSVPRGKGKAAVQKGSKEEDYLKAWALKQKGKTYKEIAEHFGKSSEGTAHTWVKKGKEIAEGKQNDQEDGKE